MNRNNILPLLSTIQSKERYEQVQDEIRHMDEAELFHGLYSIAVQNVFSTPAPYAAGLLRKLNPTCQITCLEAIRALLSDWDVSTEEIPFYLFRQFGQRCMEDAIKQLRLGPLTKNEKSLLDAVAYWTNIAAGTHR